MPPLDLAAATVSAESHLSHPCLPQPLASATLPTAPSPNNNTNSPGQSGTPPGQTNQHNQKKKGLRDPRQSLSPYYGQFSSPPPYPPTYPPSYLPMS